MSFIHIKNESTVKNIYFQGRNPIITKKKIGKNGGEETVELGSNLKMEFVFYTEDGKPATYTHFTINDPGDHVNIEITKDHNSNELRTVIEWLKKGKQKSKESGPTEPPDNVNVGVKE